MEEKIHRHTMIVLWKWLSLPVAINEHTIMDKKYKGQLPDLKKEEGKFHHAYAVEPSTLYPNARVIAARIYEEEENGLATQLLDKLIAYYRQPLSDPEKETHKVMLFLHRGNGYKEKDIVRLLDKHGYQNFKIFLFSDKRDYIYYDTRKVGLLDDIGYFKMGENAATGEVFSVLDKANNSVRQPYFDRVWQYYDNEFESKVYRLKEELYEHWFPLLLPEQPETVSRTACIQALQPNGNPLLWYRLKSFIGYYDSIDNKDPEKFDQNDLLQREVDAILEAEIAQGESMLFDDCIANINQQIKVDNTLISEEYEEIKQTFLDLLFGENNTEQSGQVKGEESLQQQNTTVAIADLRVLASKLNYLVKIIPGVMD